MALTKGDTFLIRTGPNLDDYHLFVIVSDPNLTSDETVLCVNFTSTPKDKSCIIKQGEHPFVQHDTYIDYQTGRELTIGYIQNRLIDGTGDFKTSKNSVSVAAPLLERIIQGGKQTKKIPLKFKKYFR